MKLVKTVASSEPEKIYNRMDFLLTELNFLMEVINFKKVDKDMKSAISEHLKHTIKIAERKQVFQK